LLDDATQAQASLQNFTLAPDMALPFTLGLTLDSGGTLEAKGTTQLFPALNVDATLELAGLSLHPLQPWLDQFAQLTLESGELGFSAHLRSNSDDALAWQGDLSLDNLKLVDQQRMETFFSLASLPADNIDFSLGGRRVDTSELILDGAFGRVFIDENGLSNFRQAFKPANAAEEEASASAADAAAEADAVRRDTSTLSSLRTQCERRDPWPPISVVMPRWSSSVFQQSRFVVIGHCERRGDGQLERLQRSRSKSSAARRSVMKARQPTAG